MIGFGQTPQGVNYQAVARDSTGAELINNTLTVQFSILSDSITGNISWQETHLVTTNDFGLFTTVIGQGTSTSVGSSATFDEIDWGSSNHFLNVQIDGLDMGTTQFMSVPYALYAESANINYDSIFNLLSNDSTFITNVGVGMGGGGCNYSFPEGIGQSIVWDLSNGNDYTVPTGKNLFITNVHTNDGYSFRIDGKKIIAYAWGTDAVSDGAMLKLPLCAKAGQIISVSNNPTYTETFYGILTDAIVDPIIFEFDDPGTGFDTYTVPAGKKLYITNVWAYNWNSDFTIDGVKIGEGQFNSPDGSSRKILEIPLIVNSGSVVSIPNNYSSFNGYLADENYFAGCSGGGSSSSAFNVTIDSLSQVVSNLDSSLIALTSEPTYSIGDSAQGGIVFYITADSTHGLAAAMQDQSNGSNWHEAQDLISDPANHPLVGQQFTDWRLPTKYELNLMYVLSSFGFAPDYYWSSDYQTDFAWRQDFVSGYQDYASKWYNFHHVRAIRAF